MKLKRNSKTLWFNGVMVALLGLTELVANTFQADLPGNSYAIMIAVSSVGNFALRYITKDPIR